MQPERPWGESFYFKCEGSNSIKFGPLNAPTRGPQQCGFLAVTPPGVSDAGYHTWPKKKHPKTFPNPND